VEASASDGWDVTGADAGDVLVERLVQVIDEGRRTATYKLALLAGLVYAVAMAPGKTAIPTRMIAVLALYYPQTEPTSPATVSPGSCGGS